MILVCDELDNVMCTCIMNYGCFRMLIGDFVIGNHGFKLQLQFCGGLVVLDIVKNCV